MRISDWSSDVCASDLATDHVFALCHLLGFRFAPRLRDIGDRKLGSIAAPSTYKGIENLMGRTIKTAAIEADWDDIVRIVASITDGTVEPSVILRTLAAYKRQNRTEARRVGKESVSPCRSRGAPNK